MCAPRGAKRVSGSCAANSTSWEERRRSAAIPGNFGGRVSHHPQASAACGDVCDLFRRVQIQEAVYETLTQQFELAKVQEARRHPA